MLSSQVKYQTAMRLALRAWIVYVQDQEGSLACLRAHLRCMKLAKSLRVPSGPDRSNLWIDIASHHEYMMNVNANYIACGMPVIVG